MPFRLLHRLWRFDDSGTSAGHRMALALGPSPTSETDSAGIGIHTGREERSVHECADIYLHWANVAMLGVASGWLGVEEDATSLCKAQ